MNTIINNIKARRSTRSFGTKQIEMAKIEAIIEAGMYAPSANNEQSCYFTVIQDDSILKELDQVWKKNAKASGIEMFEKLSDNEKFNIFYGAPTVVIISGDKNASGPIQDASAATQNMLLAAESLELGSCWTEFIKLIFSSEQGEAIKQKLNIPSTHMPYHTVLLGHKAYSGKAPERVENRVTYL